MTHPDILAARQADARDKAMQVVLAYGDPASETVQLARNAAADGPGSQSGWLDALLTAGLAEIVAEHLGKEKSATAKKTTKQKEAA
jgi:hypothetical protein